MSEEHHECNRYESTYSPPAYLLALFRFINHYFSTDTQTKDMDYLFGRMQRSYLKTLAITKDEVEKQIPQPKIAQKVLLNYIINNTNFNNEKDVCDNLKTSLNPRPFFFFANQFKEYLTL